MVLSDGLSAVNRAPLTKELEVWVWLLQPSEPGHFVLPRLVKLTHNSSWIMNFAVAEVTPVMITNIGYKTFIIFMIFCLLGLAWVMFVLPEVSGRNFHVRETWLTSPQLKGLTLEEIDDVFHDELAVEDRERRNRIATELGLTGPTYEMAMADDSDKKLGEVEHQA